VETIVGHQFHSQDLLFQSLTHSSYSNEHSLDDSARPPLPDNERLEFFGDAVIGLVVARTLMELFPDACEGRLSRWRSSLVSRKTLADIAIEMDLGDCILLGKGELRTGGAEKKSILAGTLEALVGALYLDAGIERTTAFLDSVYEPYFEALARGDDRHARVLDKKTHLQERTQSLYKTTPIYRLVEAWGLEHEKHFRVEIEIDGKVVAKGDGRSKKDAEQEAAGAALEILGCT
jgi:ribonuclease III